MTDPTIELPLSAVIFREDLYPRIETSMITVQKYAEDLDVLPPIEINQHNELIDGWHRWTAHKKAGVETIACTVTPTASDIEFLELAISRNAAHGLQLSQEDKRDMARRIYALTPEREREGKKRHLASILSVTERTVYGWLSRMDKDAKAAREQRMFDLWLACWTQEEIAEAVGVPQQTVARTLSDFTHFGNFSEMGKAAASHATDFEVPLYNVWKQQTRTAEARHFGNTEVRWLDNLLYLYTEPLDVVIDPFAGGGSTIDLCRRRFRRYWVSDRAPAVERQAGIAPHQNIRQHDLMDGLPPLPRWKDVRLVYLDPPYWKQAEGEYSDAPTDLANMPLEVFTESLTGIITGFAKKLDRGVIALVIQPTQWRAPERQYTDHIADVLRGVNLPIDMRYSVPYESSQCTAQMVEWAKANRRCLVLSREIVVWRV